MKCRQIVTFTDRTGKKQSQVIWFGRIIADIDPLTVSEFLYCSEDITVRESGGMIVANGDNYVSSQRAVVSSLVQQLSVIRGELWYATNVGLPLVDKIVGKGIIDAYVSSVIISHPEIKHINSFSSMINKYNYSCTFEALSSYGDLIVSV